VRAYWLLVPLLLLLALPLHASEGNQLLGVGPIQESLAGAGAAIAYDSTWVLLNPATLAFLDRPRFDSYIMLLTLTRRLEVEGPFGFVANKYAGEMTDTKPIAFPGFAVSWVGAEGMFATGMMGVEGDMVDFPHSRSTLGRMRNKDRRGALETAAIPFGYAREIGGGWALGGAALVEVSRLRTDSLTLRLRPTQGDYHWDTALGAGAIVGVAWRGEAWGFGASYRTRQYLQRFDKYDDLTQYSLDLPPQVQVGLSYRPLRNLELLLDYRFIAWTDVPQFGANTIPKGGLRWDDQNIAKLAANWTVNDDWTLRAGLSHGNSPLGTKVVFTNAQFPAVVETHLTFGFTRRLDKDSELTFSYDHAFDRTETDNGKGDLFSHLGKGTRLGMVQDFFCVGYTRKF
jgi:long-chain fatty acid transport protein